MSAADTPAPAPGGALGLLAARIGRHSSIYIATSALHVALGLVSLAVLTRYLQPAEFGKLAILLFASGLLTIVYNAGSLQGTFSWVFGSAGEDGEDLGGDAAGATDSRRGLMTGLVLTITVAAAGTAAVSLAAQPLADLLLGSSGDAHLVRYAAAAAAATAAWRLLANSLRLARRPLAYLVGTAAMAGAVLVASWILLAQGLGLEGAMAGQALGTAVAVLLVAALNHGSLRPAVSWTDAVNIYRRGLPLVPVVFSFYTIQLADVFFVSRSVPNAEVGLYRVASRVGALVSYWTSGLHMAWGPLRRDPLHVAADRELGRSAASATIATYFVVLTLWVILGCGLFAEQLVRIASGAYDEAAALIPLTGIAFAFHGFYVLIYRTAEFKDKRPWFIRLSIGCASTFIVGALLLIPWLGAYGAPFAAMCGWTLGIVGFWILERRRPEPVPYQYARMAGAVAVAAACYGLGRSLAPDEWWPRSLVELAAWAAYPLGLLAVGVVPRQSAHRVAGALRSLLPSPGADIAVRRGVHVLRDDDVAVLDLVVVRGLRPEAIAAATGLPLDVVHRRLVAALRSVEGGTAAAPHDAEIGRYLLADGSFADRQRLGEQLWRAGADPVEVDGLDGRLRALRRQRQALRAERRRWRWPGG